MAWYTPWKKKKVKVIETPVPPKSYEVGFPSVTGPTPDAPPRITPGSGTTIEDVQRSRRGGGGGGGGGGTPAPITPAPEPTQQFEFSQKTAEQSAIDLRQRQSEIRRDSLRRNDPIRRADTFTSPVPFSAGTTLYPDPYSDLTFKQRGSIFISSIPGAVREAGREFIGAGSGPPKPISAVGTLFSPFNIFFPRKEEVVLSPPPFVTRGTEETGDVPPSRREATQFERLQEDATFITPGPPEIIAQDIVKKEADRLRGGFQGRVTEDTTETQLEELNKQFEEEVLKGARPEIETTIGKKEKLLEERKRLRATTTDVGGLVEMGASIAAFTTPLGKAALATEFIGEGQTKMARGILAEDLTTTQRLKVGGIGLLQTGFGIGLAGSSTKQIAQQVDKLILEDLSKQRANEVGVQLDITGKRSILNVRSIRGTDSSIATTELNLPVYKTKEGFKIVGGTAKQQVGYFSFEKGKFVSFTKDFGVELPQGLISKASPKLGIKNLEGEFKKELEKYIGGGGAVILTPQKEILKVGARVVFPTGKIKTVITTTQDKTLKSFIVGGVAQQKGKVIQFVGGTNLKTLSKEPIFFELDFPEPTRFGFSGRGYIIKENLNELLGLGSSDDVVRLMAKGTIKKTPFAKTFSEELAKQTSQQITKQQLTKLGATTITGISKGILESSITKQQALPLIVGGIGTEASRSVFSRLNVNVLLGAREQDYALTGVSPVTTITPVIKTRVTVSPVSVSRSRTQLKLITTPLIPVVPVIPIPTIKPTLSYKLKFPLFPYLKLPKKKPLLKVKRKRRKKGDDIFFAPSFTARALGLTQTMTPKQLRAIATSPTAGLALRRIPILKIPTSKL